MPGFTSPQNFPYPLYTDPAGSGPAQIQAFAEAVDDAIVAQQTAITNAKERKRGSAESSAVVAVANTTLTNATFTTELLDNDNMVNLGVDNTAITATTAGLYYVQATAKWVANATGSREVNITLNTVNVGGIRSLAAAAPSESQIDVSTLVYATAGQIFRLSVFQSSGGALNMNYRRLSAVRLSG